MKFRSKYPAVPVIYWDNGQVTLRFAGEHGDTIIIRLDTRHAEMLQQLLKSGLDKENSRT